MNSFWETTPKPLHRINWPSTATLVWKLSILFRIQMLKSFFFWNLNTKAMRPGGGIWSLIVRGQSPNLWNQALGSFFQHVRKQILTSVTLKANSSPDSKSTVALVWDFFIYWKYEKWIYIECDTLCVVAVAVGIEWILSFHSPMIKTLKITLQCP